MTGGDDQMSQILLPLRLQDHAVFESFLANGNESLLAYLQKMAASPAGDGVFLHGAPATGKTHLLQAVCAAAGDAAAFVPLDELASSDPSLLQGMASRQFVCIDDLQRVVGNNAWEQALFAFINEATDAGSIVAVAATAAPRELGVGLADLQSRLSRLPVFQINALDDAARREALQLRASFRGFELPDEVAAYLLTHATRDMATLYRLLDRLDTESLVAKRRLTIPFVRETLQSID